MVDYDVIVAGAGPAGAAAATYMAAAGMRVIVVDWQAFPRDKVCGDFVSPVALSELQSLGVLQRHTYKHSNAVQNAAVYLDGKHLLTSAIPQVQGLPPQGRVIPRKALDEWIVKRARSAGAEICEGHRVKEYRIRRHCVEVKIQSAKGISTVLAHVLIGADGSTSTIARLMHGEDRLDDDRIIAVRGYFTDVKGPSNRADLYFTSEGFPGYCWLFPTKKNQANVGIGMVLKTLPPTDNHLRKLLVRLITDDHALKERLASAHLIGSIVGWPLTTYNGRLPIVTDRILLIGDAAGLINPLNGEGIPYALLSGRWSAEVVIACWSCGDFSFRSLSAYTEKIKKELERDLTVARVLVQLIRNRALNPLWLEALQIITARAAVDPEYAYITGGVLAGIVPVRDLLRISIVRKTLEQAIVWSGARALRELPLHPKDVIELGVNVTQMTKDILSPILKHRAESEQWALNLVTRVLDVAGVATRNTVGEKKGTPVRLAKPSKRVPQFQLQRTP